MKKRIAFILCAVMLLCCFGGCETTLHGMDDLMEKAREELPISDADTIELQYIGKCQDDDNVLFWFMSGNPYQAHYYLPMECEVVGEDEYVFVHTYKPMDDRSRDNVALIWKYGYCFVVNDPDCTTLRIGTQDIAVDEYPFIYYHKTFPSSYAFLNAEGKEL